MPESSNSERLQVLSSLQQRRWQSGETVRVEQLVSDDERRRLGDEGLAELPACEIQLRRQAGEDPRAAEYLARFPELQSHLERYFPTDCDASSLPGNAPQLVDASDSAPTTIDRYRILATLGRGNFGIVYRAYDPHLDREVALKVPLTQAADRDGFRSRVLREARAAATVSHPHICALYEVHEIAGSLVLSCAYISGQTLAARLKQQPLTARETAEFIRTVARALAESHRRGVIHRDLKPANLMIDERGAPVVMDFGLARRADSDDAQLTRQGDVLGTPAYMSPEQAGGEIDALGPATDIYSLGAVLYELLAGRAPVRGALLPALKRIREGRIDPPSTVAPLVDPRLEAICLKAMARAIADRYSSMNEFADDLTAYLTQAKEFHASLAESAQNKALVRRRRTYVVIGGAVTALLLGLGWFALPTLTEFLQKQRAAPAPLDNPFAIAGEPVDLTDWQSQLIRLGARRLIEGQRSSWSPNGKRIVTCQANDGLHLLDVAAAREQVLLEFGKDPAWCPTREDWIAFVRYEPGGVEEVWLTDLSGAEPKRLGTGGWPSWSADGQTLYVRDSVGGGHIVKALRPSENNAEWKQLSDTPVSFYPAVAPDERDALFITPNRLTRIHLPPADASPKSTALPPCHGGLPAWSGDGKYAGFGGFGGAGDQLGLWILNRKSETLFQLIGGPVTSPAWSPDGTRLSFDVRSQDDFAGVWVIETKNLAHWESLATTTLTLLPE